MSRPQNRRVARRPSQSTSVVREQLPRAHVADALRARDEDVLRELAARGGWYTLIEHVIVGPGLQGPRTVHRHATALGVDPAAGRVPNPEDLDDARAWLSAIRES